MNDNAPDFEPLQLTPEPRALARAEPRIDGYPDRLLEAPLPERRRCVTCGASRREGSICYRCKSDLTPLLAIEQRANALRAEARRCYAFGWYRRAAALVSEIIPIEAFPEDFKLLVCAALRCGDFQTACRAYPRFLSQGAQRRAEL